MGITKMFHSHISIFHIPISHFLDFPEIPLPGRVGLRRRAPPSLMDQDLGLVVGNISILEDSEAGVKT